MILSSHTNLSGFFKVIRIFLFVALFIAGMFFSGPCSAKGFTAEEEYKAQKKLLQLQVAVDDEDYMRARLILSGFQRDFAGTNCYKMYSKRINKLAKKIKKEAKKIKVEDKIEYLFVPPRPEKEFWKEYMSRAEMIISQNDDGIGLAVLRVIFENEDLELPSVRVDWNSNNELNIYSRGGYSCVDTCRSGEPVFIGSGFWSCRASDSNNKDISVVGDIIIGGIYHYPTRLKIKVQKGKAIAFGEVIVRSIPQEYCGNLIVKVETEEGLKLMDAEVNLKVYGFYSGITEPVKEGSCLFSSIGPGSYSVEVARNDVFGSPSQSATVFSGRTAEATVKAYRHRMIEFDWRFRRVNDSEPDKWLSGLKIMKTTEYWQPGEEWPDVHYPVIAFGDWLGSTCRIKSSNGDIMYIDANEPFEEMDFPSSFSPSFRDYPIKEGDIFAWRREDRKEKVLEALVHIIKITPVGIPDDQKSSVQENKSD